MLNARNAGRLIVAALLLTAFSATVAAAQDRKSVV